MKKFLNQLGGGLKTNQALAAPVRERSFFWQVSHNIRRIIAEVSRFVNSSYFAKSILGFYTILTILDKVAEYTSPEYAFLSNTLFYGINLDDILTIALSGMLVGLCLACNPKYNIRANIIPITMWGIAAVFTAIDCLSRTTGINFTPISYIGGILGVAASMNDIFAPINYVGSYIFNLQKQPNFKIICVFIFAIVALSYFYWGNGDGVRPVLSPITNHACAH